MGHLTARLELPDGKGTEKAEPDFSDVRVTQQEATKEIPIGYNRITEWLMWESPYRGHLVQFPISIRVT